MGFGHSSGTNQTGANIEGVSPGTLEELRNRGVNLSPFPISMGRSKSALFGWIKALYASATTQPSLFASYPKSQVEEMVFKILRYMIAGRPQNRGRF